MDPEDADAPLEARPPLLEDLVALCRYLNREKARYVVLGGMAVIQAGFVRATTTSTSSSTPRPRTRSECGAP